MPEAMDPNAVATDGTDANAEDIETRINRVLDSKLNAAITGHLKRNMEPLHKQFGELREMLSRAANPAPPAAPPSAEGAVSGAKPAPDPEVLKLREEYGKITSQLEAERKAREAAEAQARVDSAHRQLKDALVKNGVRPDAVDVVHTFLAAKAFKFDDAGEPKLTVKRSRGPKQPEEAYDFDLDAGVADWIKSDAAKPFLPAPTQIGRTPGSRPSGHSPSNGPRPTPKNADEAARAVLEDLARHRAGR